MVSKTISLKAAKSRSVGFSFVQTQPEHTIATPTTARTKIIRILILLHPSLESPIHQRQNPTALNVVHKSYLKPAPATTRVVANTDLQTPASTF